MTNPVDRGLRSLFREVVDEPHDMTPAPGGFVDLVECSTGRHMVEVGKDCARCEAESDSCPHCGENPKCDDCPGRP